MTAGEKSVHVIDLFRVRSPDGQITYAAWPEAIAGLIVKGLARLVTIKPAKLLLCGCGLAVLFLRLFDDRDRRRGR